MKSKKSWINLNKKVTGNWYIRNGIMYIEIKRAGRATTNALPLVIFKYISEYKIGDNKQDD